MTQARAWTWRKSSRSATEDCVEVACTGAGIRVRDSKRRRGHVIAVTPAAWDSFLGFFDEPELSSLGEHPVAERLQQRPCAHPMTETPGLDPEDRKTVTLARSARARNGVPEAAAVRDETGPFNAAVEDFPFNPETTRSGCAPITRF